MSSLKEAQEAGPSLEVAAMLRTARCGGGGCSISLPAPSALEGAHVLCLGVGECQVDLSQLWCPVALKGVKGLSLSMTRTMGMACSSQGVQNLFMKELTWSQHGPHHPPSSTVTLRKSQLSSTEAVSIGRVGMMRRAPWVIR